MRWNGLPDLAPGAQRRIQYVAAIPIFENTLDFGGFTPTPASGDQAANLDNNDGDETFDEQALTNYARATGTYNGSLVVFDDGWLARSAEDIAILKTVETDPVGTGLIEQGGFSIWSLLIRASEYRSVADIRVTDTLPDGLCPLGSVNHEENSQSTECNPVGGRVPSLPYGSVDEQVDGSFVIAWDAPDLAPSESTTITFPTRARANYQDNYVDDEPVLTRDTWTNDVSLLGTDSTPAGIPHVEPDGTDDGDVSSASQEAGAITIDKKVRAPDAFGSCDGTGYTDTIAQTFGPGDRVCWRVKVTFPGLLDTGSPQVVDFLPAGAEYEPGSVEYLQDAGGTPTLTLPDLNGPLTWTWGASADDIDAGGRVFEAQISTIVGEPDAVAAGDILGNLQKVVFNNSEGTTFPLRDQVDFEYEEAELDLIKDVGELNGVPTVGPDVDGVEVTGGDVVTYRLDIEEKGGRAAQQIEVWDLLPDGITCGDVDDVSLGGSCAGDRVTWTGRSVAALGSTTLTYDVEIPDTFGPGAQLVNRAGVRRYESVSNIGTIVPYVPQNNIDPTLSGSANAPAARGVSDVLMRAVTVDKERTTEVGETDNNPADEATIGEQIDYEITTTIPGGSTLYGTPVFTDTLAAGQTFQPGSLTVTLDGVDITGNPSYPIVSGPSGVTVTFPSTYANPSGDDELVVAFTTQVDDVAGNLRGDDLANAAKLTFSDAAAGGNCTSRPTA